MKKILGRLGSVAKAMRLAAAGLVGTATSASADSRLACAYHVAPTWQSSAAGAAEDACIKALSRQPLVDDRDVDVTETSQNASNGKTLYTASIPSDT